MIFPFVNLLIPLYHHELDALTLVPWMTVVDCGTAQRRLL
jgi:hypothetical protein